MRHLDLREQFDEKFSRSVDEAVRTEDFLALTIAGRPYAVRLGEVAGVHAGLKLAPMRSQAQGLLGLAGLRGVLVPAFDLGLLLGHSAATEVPRMLVLVRHSTPVAFSFHGLDAHWRLPVGAVSSAASAQRHVVGAVRHDAEVRPLIQLASLVDAIS